MSGFHRGEIWLVNFEPSFGHEYQKVRPALIVQQDTYIPQSSLLTVMPISSQVAKRTQLDILLEKNDRNRLRQDSLLKVQQVSSFDKRRFIKLIGRVDPQIMGATDVKIKQFLFGAEPVGNEPTSEMDDSGPATVESCSSEPTPAFPTGHDDQTCVMEGDDNGEGPHSEGTSV